METLKAYLKTTSQLADVHGQTTLGVGAKVLVARALHDVGIKYFNIYQFAAQPPSAYGDYMTQTALERILFALSSADEKALTQDKIRFHDICVDAGLPTPPIIARLSLASDATAPGTVPLAQDGPALMRLLATAGHASYIFKPAASSHGEGVERLAYRGGELRHDLGGENAGSRIDPDVLLQRLLRDKRADFEFDTDTYIVQPTLRTHPDIAPVVSGAGLCTFRIVTFGGSDPSVGYAVLKIPVGDGVTDNFSGGATGNFAAEVDLRSGAIVRCCGASGRHPGVLEDKARVPGAAADLQGFVIPDFAQVCDLAVAGARAIPHPASIGWDVALTDAGPTLLEANWRYDIQILQAALRRGLQTELTAALARLEPLAADHRH